MFTLMSWNVENFFSPSADADAAQRQAFEQKVEALKTIIAAQAPDIVGLQEIGDAEAFETLRAEGLVKFSVCDGVAVSFLVGGC